MGELDHRASSGPGMLLPIIVVLLTLTLWQWPEGSRGEPEDPRRVLVLGGAPFELAEIVREAGFACDQQSWTEADAAIRGPRQRFDPEAVRSYADEHGYGFVAVILDDEYPWPVDRGLFGTKLPAEAAVAVFSVGDLSEGVPPVEVAALPAGLEYLDGSAWAEGLRMALYRHPDLERVDEGQLDLAKLEPARAALDRALSRYEAAASAWPAELPEGAISAPWVGLEGFPVAEGLILRERASELVAGRSRELERREGPRRTLFVSHAALAEHAGAPLQLLAAATPVELPELITARLSSDRRWLLAAEPDAAIHRLEFVDDHFEDRGTRAILDAQPGDYAPPEVLAISTSGQVAWEVHELLVTSLGELELANEPKPTNSHGTRAAAWIGDELIAASICDPDPLEMLLVAGPPIPSERPPPLLTIPAEQLAEPDAAEELEEAWIESLHSIHGGLMLVLATRSSEGELSRSLIRVGVAAEALVEPPTAPRSADHPRQLHAKVLAAARVEPDELEHQTLGLLPKTELLDVAPDGRWIAWRVPGDARAIRAAPIVDGQLGEPVEIDDGAQLSESRSTRRVTRWIDGPLFTADGRTLVFTDTAPLAGDQLDLGVARFVRLVPLPAPEVEARPQAPTELPP